MQRFKTYILLIFVGLCFTACIDDEDFSTDITDVLTFSTDTVRLDTCFSKVPTPTKRFWVYNNSGKDLRCSSISLKGGNQTGYRINVNGIYLGSSQGYILMDEEIRKGDSIRVFVELTSPINGSDKPELVTDDIIFTLESGVQQKVNLRAYSWDADLLKNVVLTNDSTLSGTRPTVIYGGITVPEGKILKIAAGKTLYMHDSSYLYIYGTLECNGEKDNEVVLRGDRLDNMFDYLKYDGVSGQWGGIILLPTSRNNKITYTDIHAAESAIICDSTDLNINHSTVHNNKGHGIYSIYSNINVQNTQVTNCLKPCVEILGGSADIDYCTLGQFYPFDYDRGAALAFSNYYEDQDKNYPLMELNVRNSIITGYEEDEVFGTQKDSTVAFNYKFDHCLLRTPEVKDSLKFISIIWEDTTDTICAGTKNFVKIDTDLLQYDFHLADKSLAIDAATPLADMPDDREGTLRDDTPSIGCFEKNKPAEEENK